MRPLLRGLLIVLFSWSALSADERPTAGQVKASVEQSREKFLKDYRPKEYLKELQRREAALKRERVAALKETDPEMKAATLQRIGRELERLAEIEKETRRNLRTAHIDVPDTKDPRPLCPMFNMMEVGEVGFVGPSRSGGRFHPRSIRVLQFLGDDRFIGHFTDATNLPVLFVGVKQDRDGRAISRENVSYDVSFNAICVGTYSYADLLGGRRTIPVVEAFDPDKPFE